jgi:hypothetical protein
MFEIIFTDMYERGIERTSMYRPREEIKVQLVLDAVDRLKNDKLVYGFRVADGGKA